MATMGRPTDYKPEYNEQARKLCLLGYTDIQLADFFGVCEKTINTWKIEWPDFLQSIKDGKENADALVAASLFQRAIGYEEDDVKIMQYEGCPVIVDYTKKHSPDVTAQIFWLTNRQRQNWKRGDTETPPAPAKITIKRSLHPDARV